MDDERLIYSSLAPITTEDVVRAVASGVSSSVADALLRLALHSPDAKQVERLRLQYTESADAELRRVASLSLGHLARLHGASLECGRVFNRLLDLLDDPDSEVRGTAEQALGDLQVFRWHPDAYSRDQLLPMLTSGEIVDAYCGIFHVTRHDPDVPWVWDWCQRLLRHPHYALRAAALWATSDVWDRLNPVFQAEALGQVSRLLSDPNRWVRDTSRQVHSIIAC